MSNDNDAAVEALREATLKLAADRYGDGMDQQQIDREAARAGDVEYLLARIRYLEADRDRAHSDVRWLAPGSKVAPRDALPRIRAICAACPDLFSAVFTVLATHQGVPRQALAAAIKTFRGDTSALSESDVASLLAGLWNSGREGFKSILRTRKGSELRKGVPKWVKTDE